VRSADAPEALTVSISLTDYERDRLTGAAKEMGVSTDELVSELVRRALNNKKLSGKNESCKVKRLFFDSYVLD
jgi:hypothetical protein